MIGLACYDNIINLSIHIMFGVPSGAWAVILLDRMFLDTEFLYRTFRDSVFLDKDFLFRIFMDMIINCQIFLSTIFGQSFL